MPPVRSRKAGSKRGGDLKKGSKTHNLSKALPTALICLILIFALAYSVAYVGGPSFFGDDTVYANLAHQVLSGTFTESSFIFSVRLLQIYPIALFYKLFGVNIITDSAWDILSFLGMIAVTYLIGKELYNEYAGLLSALLLAFFPLVVQLSATISDNIPMAFITSLAVLMLIIAMKRNSRWYYFASGALLIASPLVTPEGFVIIIVVLLFIITELARKKIRIDGTTMHLLYGVVVAGLLLMLANYALSGNPLITASLSSHFYSAIGGNDTIPSTNTDPMFYINTMFPYQIVNVISTQLRSGNINPVSIWNDLYTINYNTSGFYFYALVIAIVYLVAKREKSSYIPLFWFAVGFLYLEFGPMNISLSPFHYLLSYRLGRFLTLVSVPAVLIIGLALARFADLMKSKQKTAAHWHGLKLAVVFAVMAFLIVTAIPVNQMWYQILYYERYDQIAIANYLLAMPNSTPIYMSSAFSNVPIYMQFDNLSRIYVYDNNPNCRYIPPGSYIIIPKYDRIFNLNYTPNPAQYCPAWKLVYYPSIGEYFPQYITSVAIPFSAKLYYYPKTPGQPSNLTQAQAGANSTSGGGSLKGNSTYSKINFFNLTGAGYYNSSLHALTSFAVVNNVSSIGVSLGASTASPGASVPVNVLFTGTFLWGVSNHSTYSYNATNYYLHSNVINVHYFGVELANQTGKLLDMNNGPWSTYISISEPHQELKGNPGNYLLISWNITPTNYSIGKTLKFCGGYFASYFNFSYAGGNYAKGFNMLSGNQTRIINNTVISIPSYNCEYLNVT